MTAWAISPLRNSSPPMMIGISIRSPAIDASRALSDVRSGDPGAYERTGSFTGVGTRRMPLNPTRPEGGVLVVAGRASGAGREVGAATGALMRNLSNSVGQYGCDAGVVRSVAT